MSSGRGTIQLLAQNFRNEIRVFLSRLPNKYKFYFPTSPLRTGIWCASIVRVLVSSKEEGRGKKNRLAAAN